MMSFRPLFLKALNVGPIVWNNPILGVPRNQLESHLFTVDGPVFPPDSFIAIVDSGPNQLPGTPVIPIAARTHLLTLPLTLPVPISKSAILLLMKSPIEPWHFSIAPRAVVSGNSLPSGIGTLNFLLILEIMVLAPLKIQLQMSPIPFAYPGIPILTSDSVCLFGNTDVPLGKFES